MSDVNEGSMVLYRRGIRPDGSAFGDWEVGYVDATFFADPTGAPADASFDRTALQAWVSILPASPEGKSAPCCVSVPLDSEHIDPIAHGTELSA
jgi:hypothetical protein